MTGQQMASIHAIYVGPYPVSNVSKASKALYIACKHAADFVLMADFVVTHCQCRTAAFNNGLID